MRRLGAFFFLFKFLHYIIIFFFFLGWGGFRNININIFVGMKILWIFLGGHDKIGLVLGVSSMYFSVFSYGKCTVRIFLRGKNYKYLLVCLIFPIFSGGKR